MDSRPLNLVIWDASYRIYGWQCSSLLKNMYYILGEKIFDEPLEVPSSYSDMGIPNDEAATLIIETFLDSIFVLQHKHSEHLNLKESISLSEVRVNQLIDLDIDFVSQFKIFKKLCKYFLLDKFIIKDYFLPMSLEYALFNVLPAIQIERVQKLCDILYYKDQDTYRSLNFPKNLSFKYMLMFRPFSFPYRKIAIKNEMIMKNFNLYLSSNEFKFEKYDTRTPGKTYPILARLNLEFPVSQIGNSSVKDVTGSLILSRLTQWSPIINYLMSHSLTNELEVHATVILAGGCVSLAASANWDKFKSSTDIDLFIYGSSRILRENNYRRIIDRIEIWQAR